MKITMIFQDLNEKIEFEARLKFAFKILSCTKNESMSGSWFPKKRLEHVYDYVLRPHQKGGRSNKLDPQQSFNLYMEHLKGKSYSHLATKYNISRSTAIRTVKAEALKFARNDGQCR